MFLEIATIASLFFAESAFFVFVFYPEYKTKKNGVRKEIERYQRELNSVSAKGKRVDDAEQKIQTLKHAIRCHTEEEIKLDWGIAGSAVLLIMIFLIAACVLFA